MLNVNAKANKPLFVISNDMAVSVPALPQSLRITTSIFQLLQEVVVDGHVIPLAKEVGHDHHVSGSDFLIKVFQTNVSKLDAHVWRSVRGVEVFRVPLGHL